MIVKPLQVSLVGATCASTFLFSLGSKASAEVNLSYSSDAYYNVPLASDGGGRKIVASVPPAADILAPAIALDQASVVAQAALYGISTQPVSEQIVARRSFQPSPFEPDVASLAPVSVAVASPTAADLGPANPILAPFSVAEGLPLAQDSKGQDSEGLIWTQRPLSQQDMHVARADLVALPTTVDELSLPSIAQTPASDSFSRDEAIRQQLYVDIDETSLLDRPQPVPTSSFLTPSAYGADWGDAFISVSGVTEGDRSDLDGSMSVGVGLGNAVENIGVEVAVGIISLDGFAEDGIVGAKLHKVFPQANNLGVALGWSNPIKWGAAEGEEETFYGVATQQLDLRSGQENALPLTASLGVGTGAFRSNGAIAADKNTPNIFGSLGLRIIPEVSVVTSWTGNSLGAAISTAPLAVPLVLTAGVSDITDNTSEGPRFNGSIGYSLSF